MLDSNNNETAGAGEGDDSEECGARLAHWLTALTNPNRAAWPGEEWRGCGDILTTLAGGQHRAAQDSRRLSTTTVAKCPSSSRQAKQ